MKGKGGGGGGEGQKWNASSRRRTDRIRPGKVLHDQM